MENNKCKKCGKEGEGYKCDLCGAESQEHDHNHSCGGEHCVCKCSGCHKTQTHCDCE